MTPSSMSGALPMTTASMSLCSRPASSSARSTASRTRPGDVDVGAARRVLRLPDADDGDRPLHDHLRSRAEHPDDVLLQAVSLRRVRDGAPRARHRVRSPARPDELAEDLAEADEAGAS